MSEENIYQKVIDEYLRTQSVKKTAENVGTTLVRAQRILITENLWSSKTAENVGLLYREGYSVKEIADTLVISEKTVQAYLPYTRTEQGYGTERSYDALKSENYRMRMLNAANSQVSEEIARKERVGMIPTREEIDAFMKSLPYEELNIVSDEEIVKIRDKKDKELLAHTDRNENLTVSQLYEKHMGKEPEAFRLRIELNLDGLSNQEMDTLRKYGKVETGITRDIVVPADITLHGLNYAILRAFGWQNSHLHQFLFPTNVFQKMTGGKNQPDAYGYCEYDGKLANWIDLCGVYFRYPTDDFEDIYWDDDYKEGISFRSWLRRKYTGPYTYKGEWEHYKMAHEAALALRNETDNSKNDKTIQDMLFQFEGRMDELLERLPLRQLIAPQGVQLDDGTFDKIRFLVNQQKEERIELPVLPVTDELIYAYDFGDGWEVKIRMTDCYYTRDRWDAMKGVDGYALMLMDDKKALEDKTAYDMHNQRVGKDLALKIATVIYKQRPICLALDGLPIMDDVGGVHGYVEFLKTIHEAESEERQSMRDWAKWMGWNGRMSKAENVL